jgi:peptidoglycan hydrolase CwlO-like protein
MRMVLVLVVTAIAPVVGVSSMTAPASADDVSHLRASIDDVAQRWFDAQADVQRLDQKIAANEQRIKDLDERARSLKIEATARAVDMYIGKSNPVAMLTSDSALDSARRVELAERANAKNNETFDSLTTLTRELRRQRATLTHQRDAKRSALHSLADNRSTLDAELQDARRVAAVRADQSASSPRVNRTSSTGVATGPPTSAEPAPNNPAPVVVVAAPAAQGVHPMHDHPFLVCTRNRESRGIYTVVSASGLYYGAYQFLKTTWDVTALHAGRPALVGVVPNTASEYDQDDMAWTLYQWQGNSPWGGRC